MILTSLRVVQDAVVYRESPFTITFNVNLLNDGVVPCALIGSAARALVNSVKRNDRITIEGDFIAGKRIGFDDNKWTFAVERIHMQGPAKLGRNINKYY
jgi:hypothetical protein